MVNKKDLSGVHPLFLSCFTGNFELTLLLIESGSDPLKAHNEVGATVLHICAERGFHEIAELILDQNPELLYDSEHVDGNTALHAACEWDHLDIVRLFCDVLDSQNRINQGNARTEGIEENSKPTTSPLAMLNNHK